MFELCRLRCEYAELHAPSSFGLDELLLCDTSNNSAKDAIYDGLDGNSEPKTRILRYDIQ